MRGKFILGAGVAGAAPADKIALARDFVSKEAVYFSKILYALTFVECPDLGTFATTPNLVCGYDPVYAAENMPDVLAGDVAHEILHVMMNHFERLAWCKDKALANVAADLAINPGLRDAQKNGKPLWKLHPTFVFPETLGLPAGKTAEQYYKLLEAQQKGGGDGGGGKQPRPRGKQPGAGQNGNGPPSGPRVGAGCCGGVANGVDHPALIQAAATKGRSEIEVTALVLQAEKAIKDYVQTHGRGSVPGALVDVLGSPGKRPKHNWRRVMGSVLRNCTGRIQSGGDDFSLMRPSKRSYVRGLLRPGLIEHQPVVAFILDTSGSMGRTQLLAAVWHAILICEALGIDQVWFAEADAGVAMEFKVVDLSFFRNLKIAGRGGTDFRPAFAAARKLNPMPELLVYFTDGDGEAPAAPPPGMETVWCIVPSHYNRRPAHWGHAVLVTEDPRIKLRPPLANAGVA